MQHLPFQGEYKHLPKTNNEEPADEFEIMSLAIRQGITVEAMKDMSFVSLVNILISSVHHEDGERKATQEDIDRMFS